MHEVRVLGAVSVEQQVVTSPTQRVLLSVLAAAKPEAVPFDRLVDAVWDDPPPSAENSLHSHLTRLRQVLGSGSIEREARSYRLVAPTDAERFEAALDHAERSGPQGRRHIASALGLWQGEPFGGSDHRFVRGRAERLATRWVGAVRDLARHELDAGNTSEAIALLRRILATEVVDEGAWSMLAESLIAAGNRVEALRTIAQARQRLIEVGLEPSARLREAEAAALHDHASGFARAPRVAGTLVGRGDELSALAARLPDNRWITLTGPGGVGKTRLAVEALAVVGARRRVWFVELTDLVEDDVVVAIARSVGAALRPPYLQRVAARVAAEPALLVLDCCEQAVDPLRGIGAELLSRCGALTVIATSRTPVGVPGEHLVEVAPLGAEQAGELLQLRARSAGVDAPSDAEAAALSRAVDCLPLTIEMLAAELRTRSVEELLEASADPLAALGGPGGALAASIQRSVSTLDPGQSETFRRLSLFRRPFVVEVAAGCAGRDRTDDVVDDIRVLRDRSLLVQVDSVAGRRLEMLDSVRAFGRHALSDCGDRLDVEQGHVDAMAARAAQIAKGLRTADEAKWLAIVETEIDDIGAARELAVELGAADAALTIAGSLFTLVYDRLRADLATWADEVLDAFGFAQPGAAAVAAVAALGAMHVDDHDRAWSLLRTDGGDPVDCYGALVAANLHLRAGDLELCSVEAERVVAAAREVDDEYIAVVGHVLAALAAGYRADESTAARAAAALRRGSRRIGAPTLLAYADYVDGELASEHDPAASREFLQRARERAVENGSTLAEGVARVTLTTMLARAGDPADALRELTATVRHWRDCGDWNLQWSTLRNLVEVLTRVGRHHDAALVAAAVQCHGPAPYGPEAERFAASRLEIQQRVDAADRARLEARGRLLTADELLDHAIAVGSGEQRDLGTEPE